MSEMLYLSPVPLEQAVLETFFSQLGIFSFDRAKDYVEKEKDGSKSVGASWSSLLAALAHLAAAEKAYHNMTFLGQKLGGQSFFSRKDSIRTIYTSLHNELKKVAATGRNAVGGTAPYLEELLSHLSEQLCFFIQARMEIADFYEKMYSIQMIKAFCCLIKRVDCPHLLLESEQSCQSCTCSYKWQAGYGFVLH